MGLHLNLNDRPYNEIVWFYKKQKEIEERQEMMRKHQSMEM